MVDVRVAVGLVVEVDEVVLVAFEGVRGIHGVPEQEGRQFAHGIGVGRIVGEPEGGGFVGGAVVAGGHIEDGAGDVALGGGRRLEGVGIHGRQRGDVGSGRAVAGVEGIAFIEVEVAAEGVGPDVLGEEVVDVDLVGAVVAEAAGFGPAVFLVPAVGGVVVDGFGEGGRGVVEEQDVVRVGGIGVENLHRVVFLRVVELARAEGNDFVELGAEGGAGEADGVVVVGIDGGDFDGEGARVGAVFVAGVKNDVMRAGLGGRGPPGEGGDERGGAGGAGEGRAGGQAGGPQADAVDVGLGCGDG